MIALFVLVLSAWTLGTILLHILRLRHASPSEVLLHTLCSGLGFWCCILFIMGSFYLFKPWLLVSFSIALAVPGPFLFYRQFHKFINLGRAFHQISRTEIALLGSAGIVLVITFLTCFAPVVGGIRNDEICTHLIVPKDWLLGGGFAESPFMVVFQAGNAHLLFLLASCFSPQSGPHLVSWLSFILCLLAVYRLARSFASRRVAIIALTIAAVNPLVFRGAGIAFVDLESTLFALVPLCALAVYAVRRDSSLLILCGFYMAIGCGIKPTNFVYAFATVFTAAAWWVIKKQGLPGLARGLAIVCATAAVFGSPWPTRNMLLTGSPTFPPPIAMYKYGDIKPLNGSNPPYTYREIKGYYDYCLSRYGDYRRSLLNFLRLPWDVTMDPDRFQIGDSIGTIILSFLPLVLLFLLFSTASLVLLTFAGISAFLLYFGVLPEARYYTGVIMVLSPVFAAAIDRTASIKFLSQIAWVVIAVNVAFSLALAARISAASLNTLVSRSDREAFLTANRPFYEAFRYIDDHRIPSVYVCYPSQVFYYLKARYIFDGNIMQQPPADQNGVYVLDIDYSQTLGRAPGERRGEYCHRDPPPFARLVFEGPDARVYHLEPDSGPMKGNK